jgi:hypothetical protein
MIFQSHFSSCEFFREAKITAFQYFCMQRIRILAGATMESNMLDEIGMQVPTHLVTSV